MPLSDANLNGEAESSPTTQNASDDTRRPANAIDGQDILEAADVPTGGPLRRQELERYLQVSPDDLSAYVELAGLYRQMGRPADAVRVLRKASAYHSDDPEFLWAYEEALLARSLQQLQEVTALAGRLKTVEVEEEKERCEANWALCRVEVCRARIQRGAGGERLRLTLAHALKELARFEEAIDEAERAAQDESCSHVAHLIRAQCLDAMGKRFEALPAYRAAAMHNLPAPAQIRVVAMRAALETAEALGLDLSARRYRELLRAAEAERDDESPSGSEAASPKRRPDSREWETVQEKIIFEYESATLKTREEFNRSIASTRLTRRRERSSVAGEVDARCQAIRTLYDERKLQVLEQQRKAEAKLDQAMVMTDQAIEEVRRVVVRRLDHLPGASPVAEAERAAKPQSVPEAEEAIRSACRQIRNTGGELLVSTPAKFVRSFWPLLTVCGLSLLATGAAAFIVGGFLAWVLVTVGAVVTPLLFLLVSHILQRPLRRRARELYPQVEGMYAVAHRALDAGKRIASTVAATEAADLLKRRDGELRAAERWKREKFDAIDHAAQENEIAARSSLEQELITIRRRFDAAIAELDNATAQPTDTSEGGQIDNR